MAEPPRPPVYLATLILCLCFSSLVLLNIGQAAHPTLDCFSGNYSDHQDTTLQIDIESEIALFALVSLASTRRGITQYRPANLGFRTIYLSLHFPPPKAI
jgi:hypothetical protein